MDTQNSSMGKVALAIVLTAVIVGGGVYFWQKQTAVIPNTADNITIPKPLTDMSVQPTVTPDKPTEPLSYSTTGVPVTVSKETKPFSLTADELSDMAISCGTAEGQLAAHYELLAKSFASTSKTIYHFKYTGASQNSDTYTVTLLPNIKNYASIADFKSDFDVCDAGGNEYPKMLNKNWLLFTNSCGSGFSDDSGRPVGCEEVRRVVEPTLKLN